MPKINKASGIDAMSDTTIRCRLNRHLLPDDEDVRLYETDNGPKDYVGRVGVKVKVCLRDGCGYQVAKFFGLVPYGPIPHLGNKPNYKDTNGYLVEPGHGRVRSDDLRAVGSLAKEVAGLLRAKKTSGAAAKAAIPRRANMAKKRTR